MSVFQATCLKSDETVFLHIARVLGSLSVCYCVLFRSSVPEFSRRVLKMLFLRPEAAPA